MRESSYTHQFKRDLRLSQKRRKPIDKLKVVMQNLVDGVSLDQRLKDHPLRGEYQGYRECHLEPDWLLIYKCDEKHVCFVRLGSHGDLFH